MLGSGLILTRGECCYDCDDNREPSNVIPARQKIGLKARVAVLQGLSLRKSGVRVFEDGLDHLAK